MMDWIMRRGQIKHLLYELALSGRISKELFKEQLYDLNNVEPIKHGRWIEEGLVDGNQNRYCRCSECGKGDTQAISQRVPYCWWCGAKMDDNWEEPEINPCRGCKDYDGKGGCISNGGCGARMDEVEK